jgi:acyl-CoA synthetase (AMP-forming)/AMP-acid ligase II
MAGYLPEEADADAFAEGWHRTGDVGWVEPEGWLHITDRVKEMIKVKGFQVAPAEVEAALHLVDEIPRLPSGKVLRRVLRDRFTNRNGRTTSDG